MKKLVEKRLKGKVSLQKMTVPELNKYCRNNGIKGYSGKKKNERIQLIVRYNKKDKNASRFWNKSSNKEKKALLLGLGYKKSYADMNKKKIWRSLHNSIQVEIKKTNI